MSEQDDQGTVVIVLSSLSRSPTPLSRKGSDRQQYIFVIFMRLQINTFSNAMSDIRGNISIVKFIFLSLSS